MTAVAAVLADLESAPVQDTLAVCAAFYTTGRLADAFGFEVLSPEGSSRWGAVAGVPASAHHGL